MAFRSGSGVPIGPSGSTTRNRSPDAGIRQLNRGGKSERIEVIVMVGDHPGGARITCHEHDASQWKDALAIWRLARDQFPAP